MPFEAVGDTVILALDEGEKITDSGLIVAKRELPNYGTVVSVGPGRYADNGKLIAIDVEPGDTVYFEHSAAYGLEIEGARYVSVRRDGILGIVNE
jgi:chaperonin GroES